MVENNWLKITTHEMIRNGTWCYKDGIFFTCIENNIIGFNGDYLFPDNMSIREKKRAKNKLKFVLGIDIKLDDFYSEISDTKFSFLIDEFYGLRSPAAVTAYQAIVETIAQQQVSFEFAMKTIENLVKIAGKKVEENIEGKKVRLYRFPTAEEVVEVKDKLGEAKLGYRKEYIKEISEKLIRKEIDLNKVEKMSEEEAIKYMTSFRGIGKWSAELFLTYAFRKNTYPANDLGIRRGVAKILGIGVKEVKERDVRELIEPFGKWKSLLAFYITCYDRKEQSKIRAKG